MFSPREADESEPPDLGSGRIGLQPAVDGGTHRELVQRPARAWREVAGYRDQTKREARVGRPGRIWPPALDEVAGREPAERVALVRRLDLQDAEDLQLVALEPLASRVGFL
jgi:hypothetical protein